MLMIDRINKFAVTFPQTVDPTDGSTYVQSRLKDGDTCSINISASAYMNAAQIQAVPNSGPAALDLTVPGGLGGTATGT